MPLTAILLGCLLAALHCQITPKSAQTLSSLYHMNPTANTAEQKAMEYLLLTYPQLGTYFNVSMRLIHRGKNPYGLQDVYFTLYSNQTRVSVITTLSQLSPGEFISISPLVITVTGNSSASANIWRARDSNLYILSGDEIKVINSGNYTQSALPGGFQGFSRFVNSNDTRFDRGEALLASLHPHMLNYNPQQVTYQVVSGINFNLQYSGDDGITAVTALVMVNLELEPFLLGFHVHCQNMNATNLQVACTDDLAYQIFSACESFLLVHPDLLAYELISMVSDDSTPENGLLFILTYQNKEEGTRVMAQLNILGNVFSVLSYYTYIFP